MKHTLYEDPITRRFALIRLPDKFADGDTVPIAAALEWFSTREEAIATLSTLLNHDDKPSTPTRHSRPSWSLPS